MMMQDQPKETYSAPPDTRNERPVEESSTRAHPVDTEVCVPVSSLASPGEDDMLMNPEIGDLVQFQSEGKVTRIEGDNAYVKVESINGKPMTPEDAKSRDTPEEDGQKQEFASLMQDAGSRMM